MRIKDEAKQDAIVQATVMLVNQTGFASSSVAKIAKEADVSPATIYIYYKNKEDLLVSTYVSIKHHMAKAMLHDFDETLPVRDILKRIWVNAFAYFGQNKPYIEYAEQFANSPFVELVNPEDVEETFAPFMRVLQRGIDEKIIKDVDHNLLVAFGFYPAMTLLMKPAHEEFQPTPENIDRAFTLAWDAIKL